MPDLDGERAPLPAAEAGLHLQGSGSDAVVGTARKRPRGPRNIGLQHPDDALAA